jgi:hypothetical protein
MVQLTAFPVKLDLIQDEVSLEQLIQRLEM